MMMMVVVVVSGDDDDDADNVIGCILICWLVWC